MKRFFIIFILAILALSARGHMMGEPNKGPMRPGEGPSTACYSTQEGLVCNDGHIADYADYGQPTVTLLPATRLIRKEN